MAIFGTFESLPMNTYVIRPTPFRLIIGEPIPTAGLVPRDMEALSARVHQSMSALLDDNSKLAGPIPEASIQDTSIQNR